MAKQVVKEEEATMVNTKPTVRFGGFPRWVALVVAGIILIGLGFMGGVAYQKGLNRTRLARTNQAGNGTMPASGRNFNGFGGGRRFNGQRPVRGQVTAVSDTRITITDQSGASRTFAITSNTAVSNQGQTAATSDIKTGDTVAVIADTPNSQNAVRILINPAAASGPTSTNNPNSTNMN